MEKYIDVLKDTVLFDGFTVDETRQLFNALKMHYKSYAHGDIIYLENTVVEQIGIVVSGRAKAYRTDIDGGNVIINTFDAGGIFGDIIAFGKEKRIPVTLEALENTYVIFIPIKNVLSSELPCGLQIKLMRNLAMLFSEKYFFMQERINCLTCKSIREKAMFYLKTQQKKHGGKFFTVSLNRAQLADYLDADRSALSRELSKMKSEGLIDYQKNMFKIN